MKKLFTLFLFCCFCSTLMAQWTPPLVTYKPVAPPQSTRVIDLGTLGTYIQSNEGLVNGINEIRRDAESYDRPQSQGQTFTTHGYFYSNRQQDYVRIKLKIYAEERYGKTEMRITGTSKMGSDRWDYCNLRVNKVSKYEDGQNISDNFEYKARYGQQTIYFNY